MNKYFFTTLLLSFAALSILVTGCKKDDDLPDVPPPANPPELITKIELQFTDSSNSSNTFTASFSDPDGPGGNAPVAFDSITMATNKTYEVVIKLYNESNPSDIEDVTVEVQSEADEHLFCFTPATVDVNVERTDTDGTYEVGLTSKWRTGSTTGSGTVTVTLKHQPDGAKDGTCTPGETDIEVQFVTNIQ